MFLYGFGGKQKIKGKCTVTFLTSAKRRAYKPPTSPRCKEKQDGLSVQPNWQCVDLTCLLILIKRIVSSRGNRKRKKGGGRDSILEKNCRVRRGD